MQKKISIHPSIQPPTQEYLDDYYYNPSTIMMIIILMAKYSTKKKKEKRKIQSGAIKHSIHVYA